MENLAYTRAQTAAALSYVDAGTLALADVLAAMDEEPSDDEPAEPRTTCGNARRGWRRALLWGARTVSVLTVVVGAVLALTTARLVATASARPVMLAPCCVRPGIADAAPVSVAADVSHDAAAIALAAAPASPFDATTHQAIRDVSGWQCTAVSRLALTCTNADGSVRSDITASEGPGTVTYVATVLAAGIVSRTEVTAYQDPEAVASLRAAMLANPAAYPNRREGDGWIMWSTDKTVAAQTVAAIADVEANRPTTAR
jgi:hypothetical protein